MPPDVVFSALEATSRRLFKLKGADAFSRSLTFGTPASAFSWGANMSAQVVPVEAGAFVRVVGTSKLATNVTAKGREAKNIQRLLDGVSAHLQSAASTQAPASNFPPAGWYPDPKGVPRKRYWDGAKWTSHYWPPEESPAQPQNQLHPTSERGRTGSDRLPGADSAEPNRPSDQPSAPASPTPARAAAQAPSTGPATAPALPPRTPPQAAPSMPTPRAALPLSRPVAPTSARTRSATGVTPPGGLGVQQLSRTVQWVGPGTTTTISKYTIPGGMLYVGHGLQAPRGGTDPALIDPKLTVSARHVDVTDARMGYWPAYHEIGSTARAAYLTWLAGGRRDPRADIGLVFLFMYGLERRALVDIPTERRLAAELAPIRAEMQRLLDMYGDNYSFRGYASKFLDVLDLQLAEGECDASAVAPPLVPERRWEPPMRLRVELGAIASEGRPIPADWALAWAWYHPDIHLRTPAYRCIEEFTALFNTRYRAAHGDGIHVKPGKTKVRIEYYAATSGIDVAELAMGVPDVFTMATPRNQLTKIVESVTTDLDPYSRYLGRNPDGKTGLGAAALLPEDLTGEPSQEVTALVEWAAGLADSGATTTGADVLSRWPAKAPERLAKVEAVTLATLLARHGLGLEPDVRLGGPAITTASTVVTFWMGKGPLPQVASPAYAGAATLLHLATAVAAADGHVSSEEQQHLVEHLQRALGLTGGERTRLEAHMRWLAASGVKLTGLTKRIDVLTGPQRSSIADLLVAVAAADGVISPEEVTSLSKIFKLLGVDPAEVHSRLHALLAGGRPTPATTPVTVREAAATTDPGYPITPPPRTGPATDSGTGAGALGDAEPPAFQLDAQVIEAKFAETAAVGALLADIFRDEEPSPPSGFASEAAPAAGTAPVTGPTHTETFGSAGASTEPAAPFGGLDAAHSTFLRALLTSPTWSRADLEELAETHHVMPEGAVDTINEFALDATGETLLDEDTPDTFTVNDFAREELPA